MQLQVDRSSDDKRLMGGGGANKNATLCIQGIIAFLLLLITIFLGVLVAEVSYIGYVAKRDSLHIMKNLQVLANTAETATSFAQSASGFHLMPEPIPNMLQAFFTFPLGQLFGNVRDFTEPMANGFCDTTFQYQSYTKYFVADLCTGLSAANAVLHTLSTTTFANWPPPNVYVPPNDEANYGAMNLVLGGDEGPFGWWADNVNATQLNRLGTLCTALHGRLDGFDLHAIDFNEYTLSIYDYDEPSTLDPQDDAPIPESTQNAYRHILNLMQNVCSALTATSASLANRRN